MMIKYINKFHQDKLPLIRVNGMRASQDYYPFDYIINEELEKNNDKSRTYIPLTREMPSDENYREQHESPQEEPKNSQGGTVIIIDL